MTTKPCSYFEHCVSHHPHRKKRIIHIAPIDMSLVPHELSEINHKLAAHLELFITVKPV